MTWLRRGVGSQERMPRIKTTRKIRFKKIVANENNYALAA